MTQTKAFTKEQFLREIQLAAFLGAYKFWSQVAERDDKDLRASGDSCLHVMARFAWHVRERRPLTAEEREAFGYCGLEILP